MNQVKKDVLLMLVKGNITKFSEGKAKETFKEIYEDGLLTEIIKALNWSFVQETPHVTFPQKEREAKWIALFANDSLGEQDKAFIDKKWKEIEWSLKRHKAKEKFKKTVEIYANYLRLEEAKKWLVELTKDEEKAVETEMKKGSEKLKYINRKTDSEIVAHMKEWQKYEMGTVKKLIEEMIKRNYRIHHEGTELPRELILEVQFKMYEEGRLKEMQNVLDLDYTKEYIERFVKGGIELSEMVKRQVDMWLEFVQKDSIGKNHFANMMEMKELEERTRLLVRLHDLATDDVFVVDEEYKNIARENRIAQSNGRLIFSEDENVFQWQLKDITIKTIEMISLKMRQGRKVFQNNENLKTFVQLVENMYQEEIQRMKDLKDKILGLNLYMEALGIKEATEWSKEKEKYDWLEYHRITQELTTEEFLVEIEKSICERYNLDVKGKEILRFLQSDWVIAQNKFAFVEKHQEEVIKEVESYFAKEESYKVFEVVNDYIMSV